MADNKSLKKAYEDGLRGNAYLGILADRQEMESNRRGIQDHARIEEEDRRARNRDDEKRERDEERRQQQRDAADDRNKLKREEKAQQRWDRSRSQLKHREMGPDSLDIPYLEASRAWFVQWAGFSSDLFEAAIDKIPANCRPFAFSGEVALCLERKVRRKHMRRNEAKFVLATLALLLTGIWTEAVAYDKAQQYAQSHGPFDVGLVITVWRHLFTMKSLGTMSDGGRYFANELDEYARRR